MKFFLIIYVATLSSGVTVGNYFTAVKPGHFLSLRESRDQIIKELKLKQYPTIVNFQEISKEQFQEFQNWDNK